MKKIPRFVLLMLLSWTFFTVLSIVRLTWDIARHNDPGTDVVMLVVFGMSFLVTLIRIIRLLGP